MNDFDMVVEFSTKFDVPVAASPRQLPLDEFKYRHEFLREELDELVEAYEYGDLLKQADALVDLVYVALGTAAMMGLPWGGLFAAVHEANMRKVRAASDDPNKRHRFDVRKPPGWVPPDVEMERLLREAGMGPGGADGASGVG